jgi:hypothetical protein
MAVEKTGAVFTVARVDYRRRRGIVGLSTPNQEPPSRSPKRIWEEAQSFSLFPKPFFNAQP